MRIFGADMRDIADNLYADHWITEAALAGIAWPRVWIFNSEKSQCR